MKRISALLFIVMILPAIAFAEYDYIRISNPFLHKIPIAVPEFQVLPAKTASAADIKKASALATSAADILSDTLAFTCYFKLIDRGAFLEKPKEKGITGADITYKNWRDIGSDFLITGGLTLQGDMVAMELRLFDVFKEKMVLGKRYKGGLEKHRAIVRRFCGDVMELFTGKRGMFNSRIAFESNGSGNKEIYICDFDGYAPRRVTRNNAIDLSPAWSSDGQWLAFTSFQNTSFQNHGPDLFIQNLINKKTVVVAPNGANLSPAWLPNEFALAASLSFTGDQEIYLLTGSGKIIKQLTHNWGIDVSPTFSSDGRQMAFVSKRAGTPQIFIKDMASGATQRLTFKGKYNTTPNWSPVENKVAYCGISDDGNFDIYVIDTKTRETERLTNNQGDNESPAWSPDGSLIAFSSTREGGREAIYVMTSAGTDQRRLLTLPGKQTCPRWSLNIATQH